MFPTHQRLKRHHTLRLDIDNGLVIDIELGQLERGAQVTFDCYTGLKAPSHDRTEDLPVVASPFLGLVHGSVRMAQKLAHVGAVAWKETDAYAHGSRNRTAVDNERTRQGVHDAFGRLVHLRGVGHFLKYDYKFIPAHAHGDVGTARCGANPLCHCFEKGVSSLMSAGVVDMFKAIKI